MTKRKIVLTANRKIELTMSDGQLKFLARKSKERGMNRSSLIRGLVWKWQQEDDREARKR